MTTILITGANGYIGGRLKERLLSKPELNLRLLVRNKRKLRVSVIDKVEIVEGDTFKKEALSKALEGVDIAYYLIHSMGAGKDFEERDRQSAENFRNACTNAGVKRLVYLGGLGRKESASKHLLSRIETGKILSKEPDKLQTIWLRAGIIIGSGSASFEIIRNLVQKLPVMVTPRWVRTMTQPIAVDDVISYLAGVIDLSIKGSHVIDIGGETMNFKQMMVRAAKVMGLRRFLFPVPVLSPKLSSYWLILFTPIPYQMAAALVEGLKSETLVLNDKAKELFRDIKPISYEMSVRTALHEMENDLVLSRWCDSSADIKCDIHFQDDTHTAIYRYRRELFFNGTNEESVYKTVIQIGGESGWFTHHYLWQLRGWIDKLIGGYGLNRNRRQKKDLRIGDMIDYWEVADIKTNKRLLLLAQMKLPGKAWLEFDIQPGKLIQTAHFLPKGLLGRLYWHAVSPLHNLVFNDLAKKIIEQAGTNH